MQRQRVTSLLLAACLFSASGCTYLQKRGQDLSDAIYLHGGVGLGLEAHVSAITSIAQLGLGGHVSRRAGLDGWQHGRWKETQACLAFPLFLGVFYVDRTEHTDGMIRVPQRGGCVPVVFGNRFVIGPEAGVFAGVVGIEAGVDVVELLDFLTGWFGWDLLNDDSVDVEAVLSEEWCFPRYRSRVLFQALREMTDEQLVGFIPNTHSAARILAFEELRRRGIADRLDLMIEHFDFQWFNTNEFDMAYGLLEAEAGQLEPGDPRVEAVGKLQSRDPEVLRHRLEDGE